MAKLNRETWTQQLKQINQTKLIECILDYAEEDKTFKKALDLLLVSLDPKKLVKKLKTEISAIKRGKKFLDWREASVFSLHIDALLNTIEKELIEQAPIEAAGVLEALVQTDKLIFERADDSNGDLGDSYRQAVALWGKAWAEAQTSDQKVLAEKIFAAYLDNGYGIRDEIIRDFKHALTEDGINQLEALIKEKQAQLPTTEKARKNSELPEFFKQFEAVLGDAFDLSEIEDECSPHCLNYALLQIADIRDSVDQYIDLVHEGQQEPHPDDVIAIAQRLIKAWRGSEAIDYLTRCKAPEHYQQTINALLVEAYELEGLTKEAQGVRWQNFEGLLDIESFHAYLKHCSEKEVHHAKEKALRLAKEASITSSFAFLMEMGEVATVAKWVREAAEEVQQLYYSELRSLSNQLVKQGYPLEAVLCRRILVDGVLAKSQSKYYKYAVNDLKQAMKFAEEIKDWHGFLPQADYHATLRENHKRKSSLWLLIKEAGLNV